MYLLVVWNASEVFMIIIKLKMVWKFKIRHSEIHYFIHVLLVIWNASELVKVAIKHPMIE